jgi:hypothetical protein
VDDSGVTTNRVEVGCDVNDNEDAAKNEDATNKTGRQMRLGSSRRKDPYPLPKRQRVDVYEWTARETHTTMADYAQAASNAIDPVWELQRNQKKKRVGMCNWHAANKWFNSSKNRKLFRNHTKNAAIMKQDFMALKNCPHPNLVSALKKKLYHKWEHVLKEPDVAKHHKAVFGSASSPGLK